MDETKTNSKVKGSKGRFHRSTHWGALLLCSGLAGPMLVQADSPGPDPRVLGITESLLTYCTNADPKSAAKYRERLKRLVGDTREEALAKVRGTDTYHKARQSMDDFIGKVDEHNAKRACSNGLAAH